MEEESMSEESSTSTMTVTTHYTRAATILAAICAVVFAVVGIAGNSLTVTALLRCPKLRGHATTLFVISLAASDLLFSAVNLPLTAIRFIHEEWTLGPLLCRLFPFFFYGNVAASLMNMVAITINRYVLIACHCGYARIYSRSNIFLMIGFVWLFSFGMLVAPLLRLWGTFGLDQASFSCTILRDEQGRSPKKFLMLFAFLLPCVVIIGCYSAIFVRVRRSRRNVQSHMRAGSRPKSVKANSELASGSNACSGGSVSGHDRREDLRLTKMMLTIFLCFVVCFLPLMVMNVLDDEVHYPFLHILASILAWASAVINPFIYAFKNRQYQQAFAKVLNPLSCRRPGAAGAVAVTARPPPPGPATLRANLKQRPLAPRSTALGQQTMQQQVELLSHRRLLITQGGGQMPLVAEEEAINTYDESKEAKDNSVARLSAKSVRTVSTNCASIDSNKKQDCLSNKLGTMEQTSEDEGFRDVADESGVGSSRASVFA